MENNHRSAQSILLSTNSIGSGTANNNNSSPTSHSLSRRASFTSCEIQSLNNDDLSMFKRDLFSFINNHDQSL